MYWVTDDLSKVGTKYIGEVFVKPRKIRNVIHIMCHHKALRTLHLYYYGEVDDITFEKLAALKRW